ncbi:MAG TPA: CDP-alcohol phosphatidyltransferase family protein [Candidatus Thermoplasmatota archaeon]|nr:CDP-alcohol phosphatidyltransferase family protein [Candidatus Thermoplasmatota archaeon]
MARRPRPVLAAIPHALTAARVVLVGFGFVLASRGERAALVTVILLAVLTDMVDGPVARRLGVASALGANLDSLADFVFYLALAAWAYMLEPGILVPMTPLIAGFLALYVLALWVARMRRGIIGFHNRWSRLSATFGVVLAIYILAWGWNVILFALLMGALVTDLFQRARALAGKPPKARFSVH